MHGLAIPYLRAVYGFRECLTTGFDKRRANLRRDALELRIRHGEREANLSEIGESRQVRWIARRDHDREIVGHEGDDRRGQLASQHQIVAGRKFGHEDVGLHGPGHVA
jgi:hypothetical protein